MNQSLFVVPSEEWQRRIRQRLELLEGHRLGTREEVLAAFIRNQDTFQPEARKRIALALRIFDQPPSGHCVTCGTAMPDRERYFCSTLCEQNSRLVIRARSRPKRH
jgi:predicted nucleic acid-binding Zn ribbon protein